VWTGLRSITVWALDYKHHRRVILKSEVKTNATTRITALVLWTAMPAPEHTDCPPPDTQSARPLTHCPHAPRHNAAPPTHKLAAPPTHKLAPDKGPCDPRRLVALVVRAPPGSVAVIRRELARLGRGHHLPELGKALLSVDPLEAAAQLGVADRHVAQRRAAEGRLPVGYLPHPRARGFHSVTSQLNLSHL